MNKKYLLGLIIGIVFIGLLTFILNRVQKPVVQSNKLQITASFYPLYFLSEQIA